MQRYRKVCSAKVFSGFLCLVFNLVFLSAGSAEPLELSQAEAIALSNDPALLATQNRGSALREMEMLATQLPDPELKFGVMSLPTDSFELGQEPMTQVQLGVVQKFPRGDSRALRSQQLEQQARALDIITDEQALQIRLAVRQWFIEIVKQQKLLAVSQQAESAFGALEQLALDYYATGKAPQQAILLAAVELAKAQDRSDRIVQRGEAARGKLATWIGDAAWRPVPADWPAMPQPDDLETIRKVLANHPRVQALHQEVLAAQTGVELAEQAYKPQFAVDLTYGARSGRNLDGSDRADLLSLMVRMDLPLFAAKRQDRSVNASIARSSAAAFDRDDVFRQLLSDLSMAHATWRRQEARLERYESRLLPAARSNAQATLDAIQAALLNMPALIDAQISEFELQMDYLRLEGDSLKSRARLLYLQGGSS